MASLEPELRKTILIEEINALSAIIKRDGYMVEGAAGQDKVHGAVIARRNTLEALRKLEAQYPNEEPTAELNEFGF